MPPIYSSIACNLDADILSAALPLLHEERVEAIEWSFDTLYKRKEIPPWFLDLLYAYSNEKRLIGHGVFFSLFSGRWSPGQQQWLDELKRISSIFQFDHITEHFGFMTGRDFHHGAPLSIPYTGTTLQIGRGRLAKIYDACNCPVGLENLAFSYSLDEVKRHGDFLNELLEPVNGFIILDLHNLYCQLHNFSVSYDDLIRLYPLHRVREIHISGGSWEDSQIEPGQNVRRDTHDDSVPEEVFSLLDRTIDKCPALKFVVLEQLGNALKTEHSRQLFYKDFIRMERIVRSKKIPGMETPDCFLPRLPLFNGYINEDEALFQQQAELSDILESATSYDEARYRLAKSSLANTEWHIENWKPAMLEAAINIAGKWKKKD